MSRLYSRGGIMLKINSYKWSASVLASLCATSAVAAGIPGLPAFSSGNSGSLAIQNPLNSGNLISFQNLANGLRANADVAAVLRAHPNDQLVRAHSTIDGALETRRFKHFRAGIEVLGSQALEHRDLSGVEISNELKNFDLDLTPALSDQEAATIAASRLGSLPLAGNPELKIAPSADSEDASARLIYVVQTQPTGYQSGQEVWVDAHTGEVVAHLKHEMRIAPTYVYAANMNCQTVDQYGEPNSIDAASCKLMYSPTSAPTSAGGSDADAVNAYNNAQSVLNYYSTVHGRNSYDNAGAKIVNVVHIGEKFDNAFWSVDLKLMGYGDGDGRDMGHFTSALDVAGHEMTHGVTSETAQLSSQGESGALNEAFSDFFGVMVANKGTNWRIGEVLFLANHAGSNTEAIRDLANPASIIETIPNPRTGGTTQIKDPSTVAQKLPTTGVCGPENDFCWVHTNSTIPSHTSYLIAQKLGVDKAQKLMYLTLTHYLTPNSNFKSLKKSVMGACPKVMNTADCATVQQIYTTAGF